MQIQISLKAKLGRLGKSLKIGETSSKRMTSEMSIASTWDNELRQGGLPNTE